MDSEVVGPGHFGRCPRLDRRAPGDTGRAKAAAGRGRSSTQPLVIGTSRSRRGHRGPAGPYPRGLTVAEGQGPRVYEYAETGPGSAKKAYPAPASGYWCDDRRAKSQS